MTEPVCTCGADRTGPSAEAHDQNCPVELASAVEIQRARIRELEEALQMIADFAVGHGDVCEIIARRARAALAKAQEGK